MNITTLDRILSLYNNAAAPSRGLQSDIADVQLQLPAPQAIDRVPSVSSRRRLLATPAAAGSNIGMNMGDEFNGGAPDNYYIMNHDEYIQLHVARHAGGRGGSTDDFCLNNYMIGTHEKCNALGQLIRSTWRPKYGRAALAAAAPAGAGGRRRSPTAVFALLRSFLNAIIPSALPNICLSWLHSFPAINCRTNFHHLYGGSSCLLAAGAKMVIGTLFGYRKGHVYLAVQEDPRQRPALLLELATPTINLVKEMASGLVRIALECQRTHNRGKLLLEPMWTMYCNGRRLGYAIRRACSELDLQVLTLCQAISMGAGVLPATRVEDSVTAPDHDGDDQLTFLRAKFERVVGSKDSEAFYMMNPDRNLVGAGAELCIFLLRI